MALSKRVWFGAAVATAVVGTAIGVRRCDPIPIEPPTDFSYAVHLRPRVFVMHEPLVPAPSKTLRITIAPDIDTPATVTRAVAQLRASPTGTPYRDPVRGQRGQHVRLRDHARRQRRRTDLQRLRGTGERGARREPWAVPVHRGERTAHEHQGGGAGSGASP